jgi:histidyl-tRNA synthetase
MACEAERIALPSKIDLDFYMIALSSGAKEATLALLHGLRESGLTVDINYGDRGLKGAMKAADRLGARFVAVIGDDELSAGFVKVKNMSGGMESRVRLAHSDLLDFIAAGAK